MLYPEAAVAVPVPETADPTDGVVFATRLSPNCLLFIEEAVGELSAVIVLLPEVSVEPLTEIEYPRLPLVEAVREDVAEPVELVVSVPSEAVAEASVKVRASSTLAVTVICPAVDVATVPVSIGVVQVASE